MHGRPVYVNERLPFAQDVFLGNSEDSYLCLRLALLHLVFYFSLLYQSPSSSLYTIVDVVLSNTDGVLSVNPSANVFLFLTHSGGTDRPRRFCNIFSISDDITHLANFPTRIRDCDSHCPAFLDLFLLTRVVVLQWHCLHCETLIMLLSVYTNFPSNSKKHATIHCTTYDYSRTE